MRRSVVAAFVLVIAAGAYYLSTMRRSVSTSPIVVETVARQERAPTPESRGVVADAAETSKPALLSPDERAAEIKQAMLRSMDGLKNQYAEELVVRGLARADSERVVEEFAAGIAGCLLEAGRKDAEARGYTVDEFLHGAKMIWTNSFNSSIDLKHLPPSTASCAINVSQQAGLPLAVSFEPRQASGNEPTVAVASPNGPAFDQTEAEIRDHIAKHPEIALTDLLVHCQARGCEILMQGRDIRIFDLEFDVFAEQNGFRSAVVGGDAGFRSVWLQR